MSESIYRYHTTSPSHTEKIAAAFAATLQPFDVVAFLGGMGVGKTAFVAGIGQTLAPTADISSPTFSLVQEYPITQTTLAGCLLVHMDLYRLETFDDLESIGFFDYLAGDDPTRASILLIEWSERATHWLPDHTIFVELVTAGDASREIIITRTGGVPDATALD